MELKAGERWVEEGILMRYLATHAKHRNTESVALGSRVECSKERGGESKGTAGSPGSDLKGQVASSWADL